MNGPNNSGTFADVAIKTYESFIPFIHNFLYIHIIFCIIFIIVLYLLLLYKLREAYRLDQVHPALGYVEQ